MVSNQLNSLYVKFLKRNPGYDGKVSLYGHSLGSVLSYDILCHQEILTSPFPMDWMYKEHAKEENVSANINNQSCTVGNDDMGPQTSMSVLLDEHTEASCIPMGPPVSTDSEEPSAIALDYKKSNDTSSSDEEALKPIVDQSDSLLDKQDDLKEPTSMNSEVLVSDSTQIADEVSESDKDKTIKLLSEEVVICHSAAWLFNSSSFVF
ncbi:unnamed protein product [Ilex paraguariensis]|uniref:DDHD domain-containing protein n=1 Tax=Ilex paraguariensis TaxID=185542 RepID=A0ABC8SAX1_9AQUA